MNATQLTSQIAKARQTMQIMIASNSPARARQERLINSLKLKLANLNAN